MADAPKTGGFLQTMTVVAAAIGIGVAGAYALDLHKHQCAKCGRQWRHLGAFNIGEIDAHTCPGCGEVQWWSDVETDGAIRPAPAPTRPAMPPSMSRFLK